MAKDKFFDFNFVKKTDAKPNFNIKNWGLSIQKREYQDIVESHTNRPEDRFKK